MLQRGLRTTRRVIFTVWRRILPTIKLDHMQSWCYIYNGIWVRVWYGLQNYLNTEREVFHLLDIFVSVYIFQFPRHLTLSECSCAEYSADFSPNDQRMVVEVTCLMFPQTLLALSGRVLIFYHWLEELFCCGSSLIAALVYLSSSIAILFSEFSWIEPSQWRRFKRDVYYWTVYALGAYLE